MSVPAVMLLYFAALVIAGIINIVTNDPAIFRAYSPAEEINYLVRTKDLNIQGEGVLAITGVGVFFLRIWDIIIVRLFNGLLHLLCTLVWYTSTWDKLILNCLGVSLLAMLMVDSPVDAVGLFPPIGSPKVVGRVYIPLINWYHPFSTCFLIVGLS